MEKTMAKKAKAKQEQVDEVITGTDEGSPGVAGVPGPDYGDDNAAPRVDEGEVVTPVIEFPKDTINKVELKAMQINNNPQQIAKFIGNVYEYANATKQH